MANRRSSLDKQFVRVLLWRWRQALPLTLVLILGLVLNLLAWAQEVPGLKVQADNPKMVSAVREAVARMAPALQSLTGSGPRRLSIIVAPSKDRFNELARQVGGPSWASGLAIPGRDLIILRSPKQLINPGEFNTLLAHELTHLYLDSALGKRHIPLWLEEGIAMWASGESSLGRMWSMTRAVLMDELMPLAKLEFRFPAEKEPAALAYAQSYYLVTFIVQEYGRGAITAMLRGIKQGRDMDAVVHGFSGKGLWGLEQDFKEAMSSRFSWTMVIFSSGAIWGLTALLAAVGLVLRRRAQLKKRREMPDPPELLRPEGPARIWPPPKRPGSPLPKAGLDTRPRKKPK